MNRTRLLALLLSCLALTVAGCGGDDEDSGGGGGDSGGAAAPAAGDKVSMKNIEFQPKALTVKKGATVTWVNEDSAKHDVTKKDGPGPKFSSGTGNMAKGDTYKQTLNAPGEISYVCKVHPGMEGSLTIE